MSFSPTFPNGGHNKSDLWPQSAGNCFPSLWFLPCRDGFLTLPIVINAHGQVVIHRGNETQQGQKEAEMLRGKFASIFVPAVSAGMEIYLIFVMVFIRKLSARSQDLRTDERTDGKLDGMHLSTLHRSVPFALRKAPDAPQQTAANCIFFLFSFLVHRGFLHHEQHLVPDRKLSFRNANETLTAHGNWDITPLIQPSKRNSLI